MQSAEGGVRLIRGRNAWNPMSFVLALYAPPSSFHPIPLFFYTEDEAIGNQSTSDRHCSYIKKKRSRAVTRIIADLISEKRRNE